MQPSGPEVQIYKPVSGMRRLVSMGVSNCKGLDDTPGKATSFLPLGALPCWDPSAAFL